MGQAHEKWKKEEQQNKASDGNVDQAKTVEAKAKKAQKKAQEKAKEAKSNLARLEAEIKQLDSRDERWPELQKALQKAKIEFNVTQDEATESEQVAANAQKEMEVQVAQATKVEKEAQQAVHEHVKHFRAKELKLRQVAAEAKEAEAKKAEQEAEEAKKKEEEEKERMEKAKNQKASPEEVTNAEQEYQDAKAKE